MGQRDDVLGMYMKIESKAWKGGKILSSMCPYYVHNSAEVSEPSSRNKKKVVSGL